MMIDYTKKRTQKETHFQRIVNVESRAAMIVFLKNHFKYVEHGKACYAHNVKIYNLPIPKEEREVLYDFLDIPEAYEDSDVEMRAWCWYASDYTNVFNIFSAGRSGGYLYVSCDNNRFYFETEDFDEIEDDQLREIVRVVQEFDALMDSLLDGWRCIAQNCEVYEEPVVVTKIVKRIREKEIA